MSTLIEKAISVARELHMGQVRKYTAEPYFVHPEAVAKTVREAGGTENMICAAYLHDVVEDCHVSVEEISSIFNPEIGMLVDELTDRGNPETSPRHERKAAYREHIGRASKEAQTIKLADILDNVKSIFEHDPDFARTYIQEKINMLDCLREGDELLRARVSAVLFGNSEKLRLRKNKIDTRMKESAPEMLNTLRDVEITESELGFCLCLRKGDSGFIIIPLMDINVTENIAVELRSWERRRKDATEGL
jgi:(p)ppGpp synthase/HD superfamily hydrolase